MPNAHSPHRPIPEVELLGSRRINLQEAIRGLEEAVASEVRGGADLGKATPGSSLISFQQIPRVLESLTSEWTAASPNDRSDDCFSEVRGRLIIHMHPCFLGDRLMQGMREAAGHLLMRHSTVLKHVPLGFKELKPSNSHAALVGESAYVHFMVDFRCIGFQSRQNMKLIGRLSPVQTPAGVNCTMFNNFNFFVQKSDLPQGAWFDADEGTWMRSVEKKLIKNKDKPLPLLLTRKIREDSAFLPVTFKGVLAKHMPPPWTAKVVMNGPGDAARAVEQLNGSELRGGVLHVAMKEGIEEENELVVSGVPVSADRKDLKDHFSQIGWVGFCINVAHEERGRPAAPHPQPRPVGTEPQAAKPAKKRKEEPYDQDLQVERPADFEEQEPDGMPAGSQPAKPAKRRKEGVEHAKPSGRASSASKQKPGGSA